MRNKGCYKIKLYYGIAVELQNKQFITDESTESLFRDLFRLICSYTVWYYVIESSDEGTKAFREVPIIPLEDVIYVSGRRQKSPLSLIGLQIDRSTMQCCSYIILIQVCCVFRP